MNCGEFTNVDVYRLEFVEVPKARPPQCVAADPNATLCQLLGAYEMSLDGAGTQAPYAHMNERCPGLAPGYERPADC